ncbi:unnamed protein product [Polarella glacialis]|uniref:Uncharacterized protein n=1 Tax=Polarella glacialis TaxID=89957 RepID=A0A813FQV9_POLGL|nr:unnamed protein product [Polarella glacialis]
MLIVQLSAYWQDFVDLVDWLTNWAEDESIVKDKHAEMIRLAMDEIRIDHFVHAARWMSHILFIFVAGTLLAMLFWQETLRAINILTLLTALHAVWLPISLGHVNISIQRMEAVIVASHAMFAFNLLHMPADSQLFFLLAPTRTILKTILGVLMLDSKKSTALNFISMLVHLAKYQSSRHVFCHRPENESVLWGIVEVTVLACTTCLCVTWICLSLFYIF